VHTGKTITTYSTLAIFDATTEYVVQKGREANEGMHCPLKHHYFPIVFLPA